MTCSDASHRIEVNESSVISACNPEAAGSSIKKAIRCKAMVTVVTPAELKEKLPTFHNRQDFQKAANSLWSSAAEAHFTVETSFRV